MPGVRQAGLDTQDVSVWHAMAVLLVVKAGQQSMS
jgi:hypothetical protein